MKTIFCIEFDDLIGTSEELANSLEELVKDLRDHAADTMFDMDLEGTYKGNCGQFSIHRHDREEEAEPWDEQDAQDQQDEQDAFDREAGNIS